MARRPILHMVAGPNGAGKTTLYETAIKDLYPDAEFINADELARKQFGRPAVTLEESKFGQDAAEQRRRELMAGKNSFVTESTFSHPSKLDLLRDARAQGYEIRVYHVNVRSPELSVARVASRVERGGHPVPEEKIRERYERNQALIRDAVRMADRGRVFDNSRLNEPHRIAIDFRAGQAVRVGEFVPSWARQLYADDLARFAPDRVNAPAASFKRAEASHAAVTLRMEGEQLRLQVQDEGLGFPANAAASDRGLGLIGMRERVQAVGGTLTVASGFAAGTTVTASLPLVLPNTAGPTTTGGGLEGPPTIPGRL